jgi:hypothetical protein
MVVENGCQPVYVEFHHDRINQTPPDMSLRSLYLDRNSVALIGSDHLMILLITLAKIKHADSFVFFFKNKKEQKKNKMLVGYLILNIASTSYYPFMKKKIHRIYIDISFVR